MRRAKIPEHIVVARQVLQAPWGSVSAFSGWSSDCVGLWARHRQRPCPLHVHKLSVLRSRSHDKEALRPLLQDFRGGQIRNRGTLQGKAIQKPREEKDTQCQEQEQKDPEAGRQVARQVGANRQAASLRGTQKEPARESRADLLRLKRGAAKPRCCRRVLGYKQSPKCVRTHWRQERSVTLSVSSRKRAVGVASAVVSVAHLTDLCLGLHYR